MSIPAPRSLAGYDVFPIGLGCMNLSHAYGPPVSREQAQRVLYEALDLGVTHFDTAAMYGFGHSENLLGDLLSSQRQRIVLASKCGMTGVDVKSDGKKVRVIDGRPETIKQTCDGALQRLRTDVIDLYYLHRWDKKVPIEESVGALGDLVRAGKIRQIGLSEVSVDTLRRAHAEHPIGALQSEYSLWTRNPEIGTLAACAELGITFVAFSPVARAFLCNTLYQTDTLDAKDIRRGMPRFEAENYEKNLALLPPYVALAQEVGCTPAQLALAWLLHRAPHVVPIPGTTSVAHLRDNVAAAQVKLSDDVMQRLDGLIHQGNVAGARYSAQGTSEVDTENFA
jgi:aryl-alcohol dehydrogenase-like predicted oxidoreductase